MTDRTSTPEGERVVLGWARSDDFKRHHAITEARATDVQFRFSVRTACGQEFWAQGITLTDALAWVPRQAWQVCRTKACMSRWTEQSDERTGA